MEIALIGDRSRSPRIIPIVPKAITEISTFTKV